MKIEKMNSQKTFPLEKIRIISCIILLVMTFASCVDYSDEATAISAKVQVTAPEEFTNGSSLEGKTVSLLNAAGNKFTAKTDANGVASFSNLVPDVYTLSTSWELTPAEYAALTGDNVVNEGALCRETSTISSSKARKPSRFRLRWLSTDRLLSAKSTMQAAKITRERTTWQGSLLNSITRVTRP